MDEKLRKCSRGDSCWVCADDVDPETAAKIAAAKKRQIAEEFNLILEKLGTE